MIKVCEITTNFKLTSLLLKAHSFGGNHEKNKGNKKEG